MNAFEIHCSQIKYTGPLSFAERCSQLEPSYTIPIIEENKIYVEWNGQGEPDAVEFKLGKWIDNKSFQTIYAKCGKEALFPCVPDGKYSIVLLVAIYDDCGNKCEKMFDIWNFDSHGNKIGEKVKLTVVNNCDTGYSLSGSKGLLQKINNNEYLFLKGGEVEITVSSGVIVTIDSTEMDMDRTATIDCPILPQSDLYIDIASCPTAAPTVEQICDFIPSNLAPQSDSTPIELHYKLNQGCSYNVSMIDATITGDTNFIADSFPKFAKIVCGPQGLFVDISTCPTIDIIVEQTCDGLSSVLAPLSDSTETELHYQLNLGCSYLVSSTMGIVSGDTSFVYDGNNKYAEGSCLTLIS